MTSSTGRNAGWSNGLPSPRGADTFLSADACRCTPGQVVEGGPVLARDLDHHALAGGVDENFFVDEDAVLAGGAGVHDDHVERLLPVAVQGALRVAGDLEAVEVQAAGGAGARVLLGRRLPLHEERQLRVGLQALHPDLLPLQLHPVGAVPVAVRGLTAEPLLHGVDVRHGDDPAEPPAAGLGAGPHGLPEGRLVGGRVVEDLDDLQVGALAQRKHHVAGAEAWVDAPVSELLTEQLADPVSRARQTVGPGGVREMVQAHTQHSRRTAGPRRHRGPSAPCAAARRGCFVRDLGSAAWRRTRGRQAGPDGRSFTGRRPGRGPG